MMTAAPESNGVGGSCRAFPCQLIELLFKRGILSDVAVTPTKIERPAGENDSFTATHCQLLKLERVDADSLFTLATSFLDGRRCDLSRVSKSASPMSSPPNSPTRENSCPVAHSPSTPENAFPDIQLDTMSAGACAVYGDRCDDEAIMCTPMRACALHLRLTNADDIVLDDNVDFGDPISHIVERYWGYFSGRYVMSISSFGKQIQALSGAVNESAAVIAELMRRLHNRVQTALRNVLVYRACTLGAEEPLEELNAIAAGLSIPLPAATAHRVLIGCCIVGTKLCSDKGYKMSYYAQLGGMTLKEVCQYEKGVLDLLGYEHLFVGQEHLQRLLEGENHEEDCSYSPTPLLNPASRTLSYPTSPLLKAHGHSGSSDDDIPRAPKSGNASSYTDPCGPSDDCRSNDGRAGLEATLDRAASRHKTVALSPTSTGRFTITNTVTGAVCRNFVAPPPLRQRETPPLMGRWATPPLRSPCTSEGVPSPIPDWGSPSGPMRRVSESSTPPLATPLINSFQSDGYDYKSGITSALSTDDLRSEASSVGTLQRAVRLLGDSAGYADTVDHHSSPGVISPSADA